MKKTIRSWIKEERRVLLLGAAAGFGLGLLAIVLTWLTRFSRPSPQVEPTIVMIYPEFVTETPVVEETLRVSGEVGASEGDILSGQQIFLQGQWVQVANTDDLGLRLRSQAGTEAAVVLVALENEIFEVRGGPEDVGSSRWWFLVNPYDSSQSGWADDRYLQAVE